MENLLVHVPFFFYSSTIGLIGWIRIKPAFWADGEILLAGDRPERENGKEIRAFPATQA